jgi:subtilase family serine protease
MKPAGEHTMHGYRVIFAACSLAALLAVPVLALKGTVDGPGPEGGEDPKPDLVASVSSTPLRSPNQNISITVTVKNIGEGSAPNSSCDVFVRNGHSPRQTMMTMKKAIRALEPGDQYAFSFSVKLGLGLYEVVARVDRKKKVPESDETNNETRLLIEGK